MSTKHQEAARQRGEARSAEIEMKVRTAMRTVEGEMKANEGIYPNNGGAVSKNEIARRAGISLTTLFSPRQKALGQEVGLWLTSLKRNETVGRQRVRRSAAERAGNWKIMYEIQVSHYIKAQLDIQQAEAERDEARAELNNLSDRYRALRDENAALLEQLCLSADSNIKILIKK